MENVSVKKPRILFVDDESSILSSLRRFSRRYEWVCEFADSGESALALLQHATFDVIVSDMRMPKMSGADLLTKCLEHDAHMVRVLLTGYSDIDALGQAVNKAKIYNYVTKPWDNDLFHELLDGAIRYRDVMVQNHQLQSLTQEQNQLLAELNGSLEKKVAHRTRELGKALQAIEQQRDKLKSNLDNIVTVLSSLIDHRETKQGDHNRAVADLCVAVANQMQLSQSEIDDLRMAALLHDIGLLGLNDNLHHQPLEELRGSDLKDFQRHPIIGQTTLAGVGGMDTVAEIIRSHHEKIDGSGFPDGLRSAQISLPAKILGAVNDYHDLLHGNLVRGKSGCKVALHFLSNTAASQYDQNVVTALAQILTQNEKQTRGSIEVNCSDLAPDMKLAADLYSEKGLLLLSKGSTLSDECIERLRDYEKSAGTKLHVFVEVIQDITLAALPSEENSEEGDGTQEVNTPLKEANG